MKKDPTHKIHIRSNVSFNLDEITDFDLNECVSHKTCNAHRYITYNMEKIHDIEYDQISEILGAVPGKLLSLRF